MPFDKRRLPLSRRSPLALPLPNRRVFYLADRFFWPYHSFREASIRAEFRRNLFMMPRSKKLLNSGDQEYFNEKRPVNVRVDSTAHLAELFPRPARDADEYPAITVVLSEWSATPKLSLDHAAKSWLLALSKTDQPS